ncbi:thiol reductant ABC exporter subunit CydD [Phyllobacterium myrsinacearum]|uniref:ATP-binding cassette subfamily C protein CydD n=1 Tax=Phyllobacterium myrsinacearum TaxID=28101 RepID=A0A839EMU0_9HYPH|nr:thiol reductant ABC exporter subunit CydD [Phyllobacterium myrsinacearum]MBA8881903.1 ATP-binding cassette subfamily C protein CydD [Phyllobacterium myrsinacearum]
MSADALSSSIVLRTDEVPAGDSACIEQNRARTEQVSKADDTAPGRNAAIVQAVASLLWLPQAGLLSIAVGQIAAGNAMSGIAWLAVGVLLIGVARALIDAAGNRLAFRAARTTLSQLRSQAITALSRRSPLDPDRIASGAAASILAEQAEAVVPYLARFRPARFKATIIPVAILVCVLPLSWAVAIVLLVAAPLIPIFMALIGWRAKAASEAQLVEVGGMNAFLLDRLRGLATIRSLDAVDRTAKRLRADAESLRTRTMAVLRIAFLSSAVLELFAALGVAMVAVYVGFHLLGQLEFGAWSGRLSLSEGLFILLLAPAFFEPLRELSSVWHDRAAGEASLEALRKLAVKGMELPDGQSIQAFPQRAAQTSSGALAVRIENLTFRYAGDKPSVFENFSLDIASGETVALLGPSGSGKSTLLALIAGLASPEHGKIDVAGASMSGKATRQRKQMAWVGQRPHIFAGTVAANIALGRPEADVHAVASALHQSALDDVANARGKASIGEGGTGLSGGEALRLALARATVNSDASIILADEPTAHLDSETAKDIADRLFDMSEGRTLIIATHDPVLAARAGRVIDLLQALSEGRS